MSVARWYGKNCGQRSSTRCGCGCGRICGFIFLRRLVWGPRLLGRRRDGLLYGLLNCHDTRRTRGGLLPYLATTNEPGDEESDEESDEQSEKRPHSNPHCIPPAPPYVSSSSAHGAIPSSIVVNEARVATAFTQQGI